MKLGFVCGPEDGIVGRLCPKCQHKIKLGQRIILCECDDQYHHTCCAPRNQELRRAPKSRTLKLS